MNFCLVHWNTDTWSLRCPVRSSTAWKLPCWEEATPRGEARVSVLLSRVSLQVFPLQALDGRMEESLHVSSPQLLSHSHIKGFPGKTLEIGLRN